MRINAKPITDFTGGFHKRFDYTNEAGEKKSVKVYKTSWNFEKKIPFDNLKDSLEYELEIDENENVISISEIGPIINLQDKRQTPQPDQSSNDSNSPNYSINETIDYTGQCEVIAYSCAKDAFTLGKDYKNHVKSLPMMIRANGLGATLAYLKSKEKDDQSKEKDDQSKEKDDHFKKVYEHLKGYLKEKNVKLKVDDNNIADAILNCTSVETRELTKDALTFLSWLRRFADGLIKV